MPVAVELNGLLPGRGPGRGACRWPGAGGAVGRGPAAAGRGTEGRCDSPGPAADGPASDGPADGPAADGSWAGAGRDSVGGTCGPTL
jgi:hypothetical protein